MSGAGQSLPNADLLVYDGEREARGLRPIAALARANYGRAVARPKACIASPMGEFPLARPTDRSNPDSWMRLTRRSGSTASVASVRQWCRSCASRSHLPGSG
jgi:hypothetical protein